MSAGIALAADALVALLLVATIATSIRLSARINRLKADQPAMRATIGDLLSATASAERAIAELRATVQDCDQTLAERLAAAARRSSQLAEQVSAGETVISRVAQIADLSRKLSGHQPPAAAAATPTHDGAAPGEPSRNSLRETIRVAREVADRATRRLESRAA